MTISTRSLCYGIAFAIVCVCLTVAVDAQAPATSTSATSATTPAATPADPTAPAVPPVATDLGLPGGMPPSAVPPGMPAAGAGAMPGMGMQPGTMGAYGTMPMGGMSPMGMRPGGGMGYDPEMSALLARRLMELQTQLTQLNTEISMSGGETSAMARPLLAQRVMLQGQIRELELQINPSGATTSAMPGAMGAMPQGGMPGYGAAAPTAADMMAREMAMQGMRGTPGYGMQNMMPGMPGAGPNAMMLEQLRQDAITELQYVQRTLSFIDANDPVRATIEARQSELLDQLESLNRQLGQSQAPSATPPVPGIPNVPGSTATTLAERMASQPTRSNAPTNPEIVKMQNAARELRAMGNTDLADDLQRRIEQMQTQGFVEPQLPPGMPMSAAAPLPAMPMPIPATVAAALPQQAELIELRNTVDSLRNEIVSLRDEIRALQILLQQGYQEPLPPPTPSALGDLPPDYNTVE